MSGKAEYEPLVEMEPMSTRTRRTSSLKEHQLKIRAGSEDNALGDHLLSGVPEDGHKRNSTGKRVLYLLLIMTTVLGLVALILSLAGVNVLGIMGRVTATSDPNFGDLTLADEFAEAANVCAAATNPNGKVIEITAAMQSDYVKSLEKNFYKTPLEVFHLSDADLVAMDIPLPVVKCVRVVEQTYVCDLTCTHGGVPDASCATCTGCLGGWSGADCSVWDNASGDSNGEISSAAADATSEWADIQAKFSPMPGSVGYGVDILTGQKKLPVVQLTYGGKDFWTNSKGVSFNLPAEAKFEPISTGFTSTSFSSWAFKSMDSYVKQILAWSNDLQGAGGVFGEMDSVQSFFDLYFAGEQGFAVAQEHYQLHKMSLPTQDNSSPLHPQCLRALYSLPPDYSTPENKAMYQLFIDYWGTSFASVSTNGGILQKRIGFDKTLISEQGETEATVGATALADIQAVSAGGASTLPASGYTVIDSAAYGGDPETLASMGDHAAWVDTIDSYPVPIDYSLSDISALIPDGQVRQNVQNAIQAYIAEFQSEWAGLDTCPTCSAFGTCAPPAEVCTCSKPNMAGVKCDTCKAGWSGADAGCEVPVCSQGCSIGSCTAPDVCTCSGHAVGAACDSCAAGWSGGDCSQPVCDGNCNGHGSCTAPNECTCTYPHGGSDCSGCIHGFSGPSCDLGQNCFRCFGTGLIYNDPFPATNCPACTKLPGKGQIPADAVKCFKCHGSGLIFNDPFPATTCGSCHGDGYLPAGCQQCNTCHGSGLIYNDPFPPNTCGTCRGTGHIGC